MTHRTPVIIAAVLLIVIAGLWMLQRNAGPSAKGKPRPAIESAENAVAEGEATADSKGTRGSTRVSRIAAGTPVHARVDTARLGTSAGAGKTTDTKASDGVDSLTRKLREMQAMQAAAEEGARRRMLVGYVPAPNIPEEEQRPEITHMISRARADMRSLATALESYAIDNNSYPIATTSTRGNLLHSSFASGPMPTFLHSYPEGPSTITSPISYITSYPRDPFAAVPGDIFAYYTKREGDASGWVLLSPGPDGKFDFDYELYSPLIALSPQMHYDPSNGLLSSGDLIRSNR